MPGAGARSMRIRRLRAQCRFGGRSCGARLVCACGGEVWCRWARRWEVLCRLLARLVGGDLLAWLRCGVWFWLLWLVGELSFAFALFRWNFKNKLNDDDGCQWLRTCFQSTTNSTSCIICICMYHHIYLSYYDDKDYWKHLDCRSTPLIL